MAVAARPGPSDARVPCPLCGGLIHPIAGKCKHCKADLSSYHAARPAANAPLPALLRAAPAARAAPTAPTAHDIPRAVHGHAAAHATIPHSAPVATAREVSQSVLPPRPTTHAAAVRPGSSWRSWPALVILLATVAIVVAAVLMVWPAHAERGGKRALQPPPAPERMDTQNPGQRDPAPRAAPVTPRSSAIDPWQPAQPSPDPGVPGADPDPSADASDDVDLFGDPHALPRGAPAPRGRRKVPIRGRGVVMFAMADHLCRKMVQCGNNDPTTARVCNSVATTAADLPANCPAANRCLQAIDAMDCAAQSDDLSILGDLVTQFRDCADATRC